RKLMDVSRLFATGWRPRYSLQSGLEQTYAWFLQHIEKGDLRLGAA
ncbi:MAG: GDP-L-fucose synthase, partial [Mesorhizobium sp.]